MSIPAATLPLLLAAMLVSIVLMRLNQNAASPPLLIADRWLRWLIFAVGGAYVATEYELVQRPFWVLAIAFFLTWFLLVTLYDWLAISAHSVSPLPLFPSYSVNSSGDEWPVQPRLLRTREWLRSQGFRPLQALKADIDLQDIPVIFISATASMEDRVRALDLGAIDFVGNGDSFSFGFGALAKGRTALEKSNAESPKDRALLGPANEFQKSVAFTLQHMRPLTTDLGNIADVVAAGASILVAGNAIFGAPDAEAATRALRAAAVGSPTSA